MARSGENNRFHVKITGKVFPEDISCDSRHFFYLLSGTHHSRIEYTITNVSNYTLQFHRYVAKCKRPEVIITLQDEENIRSGGTFKRLNPQDRYLVKIHLSTLDDHLLLRAKIRIKFWFNSEGNDQRHHHLSKFITYDLIPLRHESLYNQLNAARGERNEDWSMTDDDDDEHHGIIWLDSSLYRNESLLIFTSPPDRYSVPVDIRVFIRGDWPAQVVIQQLGIGPRVRLNSTKYSLNFHRLLYLEELQHEKDLKSYTMRRVQMRRANRARDGTSRYKFQVPGLVEKRPSVMRGDRIFAKPLVKNPQYKYEGEVDDISQKEVYVYFHEQFSDDVREMFDDTLFKIEFRFNRLRFRLMHRAVDQATENETALQLRLFPQKGERFTAQTSKLSLKPLRFFSKLVEGNPEQKKAVQHIVHGTSGPAPYIIYGPPGTGKTFTLVEAIKQIYITRKDSKIIVCAPSNHAADLIVIGLMYDIDEDDILRLNAVSRPFDEYTHKIQSVSNCSPDTLKFIYPEKEVIEVKRIVVCTLSISGRLVSADMCNHFTHLFIDEAGFATEPETLIPFSLVADCKNGINGQIVLAGDPLQLGPVIRSHIAEHCLLGRSLLERLMNDKDGPYQPDDSNTYDSLYVTKLVQSFRSHPDILKVPNELFYNNELVPCANVITREKFCRWEHLGKEGFPIIFHGVNGRQEQNRDSPSWYNNLEAICVQEYVKKLLTGGGNPPIKPKEIGIISPYHRQVKQIRRALRGLSYEDMDKLKVGSVEKFQGDQQEVIIVSTVRSDNTDKVTEEDEKARLGFVANPKRFNVALTRPKALLIIIGNANALILDVNWRRWLTWVIERGGYKGIPERSSLETDMANIEAEPANELNGEGLRDHRGASAFQQVIDDEWRPAE